MNKMVAEIIFGRSSVLNGFLALIVVGAVALGCTCNEKDGFKLGSKDSNAAAGKEKTDKGDDTNRVEKSDASKGEMPSDSELEEIVKTALLDFDSAVKNEDFEAFYESTSKPFKKSTSPRRLKKKFDVFIKGKASLSGIRSLKPKYSPLPRVEETRGIPVLKAKGEFPTKPKPSTFDLQYVAEGGEWKLISIQIYTTVYRRK